MAAWTGTRHARVLGNASASARTIIPAGSSAILLSVYAACDGVADLVNVQDADGDPITDIAVGVDDTEHFSTPVLIENGLLVVSEGGVATTFITVIWRPDA